MPGYFITLLLSSERRSSKSKHPSLKSILIIHNKRLISESKTRHEAVHRFISCSQQSYLKKRACSKVAE
ncbi:hypothetical protein JTE90_023214 [Oedothorax gibbosus]|uniref:Uncharacterized protein n=1 Tax=Oedothorax gibbosus TaxID=931172 RepID=A0AAV6VJP3_9ARAC|nr:hypothetical protein JTE90_023214 [Oedothorax gibbosus]